MMALLEIGAEKEQSRATAVVAQSLRGLSDQYESVTYLAVVALSTADWEMLLKERSEATGLTARFEEACRTLRSGGKAAWGGMAVTLPGIDDPEILRAIDEAARSWREMDAAHVRVLRFEHQAIQGNSALEQFRGLALEASLRLSALDEALRRRNDAALAPLVGFQWVIPISVFTLSALLGAFVLSRLIVPLGASMTRLEESEGALRVARDELEKRVIERTSELGQVNEDLRQRTEVLDSILKNMGDAVLVTDTERQILLINATGSAIFGLDAAERRATRVLELYTFFLPDGVTPLPAADRPITRALRGDSFDQVEVLMYSQGRPEGVWLSITGRPLYDPDRALRGAVVVFRDVSLRKKAEQALQRSHEELELRVRERTRELKEAQRRALDLARQAGMMEVATNILHNVGNVLHSVNTSATLLNERLRSSRLPALGKAAAMLKEQKENLSAFLTSDPRGQKLPDYIDKLSAHLLVERDEMLTATDVLGRHIEHIRTIVNLQQSYAKTQAPWSRSPCASSWRTRCASTRRPWGGTR